jgi:hypothetical protein
MQDTRIKIVFCTQNTKQNIFKPHAQTDKYNRNRIYHMKYIGQTGWTLTIRYKDTFTPSETTTAIPDIQATY